MRGSGWRRAIRWRCGKFRSVERKLDTYEKAPEWRATILRKRARFGKGVPRPLGAVDWGQSFRSDLRVSCSAFTLLACANKREREIFE